MAYLVIDLNSIASSSMLVGKDPDGYKVEGENIPTFDYGYGNFVQTLRKTMDILDIKPHQVICVFDAQESRKRRQKIYPNYKVHRQSKPKEYYDEFNQVMAECKRLIRHLGGIVVSAHRTEADDTIAHIASRVPDCIIWSKDKDLLSIGADMFLDGQLYLGETAEDRFLGIDRKYIPLYRTLVSDTGDFGPGMGAKGFGEGAFVKLMALWGNDGLDEMIRLIETKSIKDLSEDVSELPVLQKIIDSEENVYTTWELANWLPVLDHKLKWEPGYVHEYNNDLDFVEYYGQQTLVTNKSFEGMKQIVSAQIMEAPFVALDIETDVFDESNEWLKSVQENVRKDAITVDVLESQLCGLSITVGDNTQHTYYFPVCHHDTDNIDSLDLRDFLIPLLMKKRVVCHNASGFELPVLYKNWEVWLPNVHDSQIAAGYVDENSWKGLKILSDRYFHYKQQTYQDVIGDNDGMSDITGEAVLGYGCDDTIMTAALYNFFTVVMHVEGTFNAYDEVETDAQYMVAHAFVNGVNTDLDVLKELQLEDEKLYDENYTIIENHLINIGWDGALFVPLEDLSAKEIKRGYYMLTGEKLVTSFRKIDKVCAQITANKGNELLEYTQALMDGNIDEINTYIEKNFIPSIAFKPNSPKQVSELMYEYMKVPIRYRNDVSDTQREKGQTEGAPSTDEDSLKWAIARDTEGVEKEVLEALLTCRSVRTRNSLYYNPYPYLVHWADNKLHPSLKQSSTTSRRFAPSAPNVNQIPKRKEEGKKIRRCVIPHHKDALIVSPDFSGQELRLAAECSQDANFLSCYVGENLKDLHGITGFAINQKQGNEYLTEEDYITAVDNGCTIAKKYRGDGKSTNFLSQYGGGAFTLGKRLVVDEADAQIFLDARSAAFPELEKWATEYTELVMEQKYATTLLGARKHVDQLLLTHASVDHILRSSLNFKIQSSAAEMTKLVMGKVWRAGLLHKYDTRFLFAVHDELCFSVAEKDFEAFCRELKPLMCAKYADMNVPIVSSLGVGPNFGELKELEWPEELAA